MNVNWNLDPFGVLGGLFSYINTKQTNKMNLELARETNAANREMVEMQNKAAAQESEKAFKRSSAPTQVSLMTSAGMSRAGAINALNGGGTYTPAPVNTSQDSAPQMQTADYSALSNVLQLSRQKAAEKHDEKMQAKQLQEQKRQFDENLNFEKQKWLDEQPYRQESLTALQFQNKINSALESYTDENGKKHNLLVEGPVAERIANMAEARLNTLKLDLINSALELPANVLKSLITAINEDAINLKSFIDDVRDGKKTVEEVRNYTKYDNMPNFVESDGKKFKRIKLADGVYEWREVK